MTAQDTDEFMLHLKHPLKKEIAAVLTLLRVADPAIQEGIKWNAPSFRVKEYFATVNLRSQDAVQIILHLGAKVRHDITDRVSINDPGGLLQWLGKDRASIKFRDLHEIETNGRAFQGVIRQWITHVDKEGVSIL
jgi:hypothetical protein